MERVCLGVKFVVGELVGNRFLAGMWRRFIIQVLYSTLSIGSPCVQECVLLPSVPPKIPSNKSDITLVLVELGGY